MKLTRRDLYRSALAGAAAAPLAPAFEPAEAPALANARAAFPWLQNKVWLTAADYHPIGAHSIKAMENYLAWRSQGPAEGRHEPSGREENATRDLFARLIHAKASEIAFVESTTDGENLVVAGMDLAHKKGNVVLDDLHYQASKYLYHMLAQDAGVEVRIVHHRRDGYWRIDPGDMEKAIDRNTRLVSLALVSNINGYLHHVRSTAKIAHANGAYVYADIIQGCGAIPIDVGDMGIDFAACGAYKWLMGDFGFGFLYVREDLQDAVARRSRYGVRQFRNPNRAQADSQFEPLSGAARYETGSLSQLGRVCAHAALEYIQALGIDNIRAHSKELCDRLQKEIPKLGYQPITPPDNPTSVVSFLTPDYQKAVGKINQAFGGETIAFRRWEVTDAAGKVDIIPGMRISPSVYNTHGDIDRLLNALA